MQRTLLALALIMTAGASYAQTMTNEPRDPYGRPLIGRNDWVRQPGDQPGVAGGGSPMGPELATAPAGMPTVTAQPIPGQDKLNRNNKLERDHAWGQEPVPMDAVSPRQAASRDEYGFRYDNEGNRLDGRGNIISPHIPQR
jgi:hypothetical protein